MNNITQFIAVQNTTNTSDTGSYFNRTVSERTGTRSRRGSDLIHLRPRFFVLSMLLALLAVTASPEREMFLLYAIGAVLILLIIQSICFIVYIIRAGRKRRYKRKHSCIPYVREPLPNQENNSERYSSRPLKQVPDPEIYESLKDLIESAPPLPPISTLPKRKPGENYKLSDTLSRSYSHDEDKKKAKNIASRPRQPLPNEIEAAKIMSKNNISLTMPRLQYPKPIPTPIMSSTLSRYTNRESPVNPRRPIRPIKPEISLQKPPPSTLPFASQHVPIVNHSEIRTLPKPQNQTEAQAKYSLPPPEPHHEIPADSELLRKLKKRAQLTPISPQEIPMHQITNNPPRVQPQQMKQQPHIQNELMQKLKKRAALIPDSQNQQEMQKPINLAHRVKTPKSKPVPPPPPRSDAEDTWVDNFDNREALEQINMYNI